MEPLMKGWLNQRQLTRPYSLQDIRCLITGLFPDRANTPLLPPQNHQKVDQQRRESYIPSDDVKEKVKD
jgi:hypothetical protein